MRSTIAPGAERELIRAARRYLAVADVDTASRFLATVQETLTRIEDAPHTWPMLAEHDGVRRCRIAKPFDEYAILYRVTRRGLRVLAIAHARRRPHYWLRRR